MPRLRWQGLIDEKIWSWANALREQRNLGAHASVSTYLRKTQGRSWTLPFAICEYVYVLAEQFNAYMARKGTVISRGAGGNRCHPNRHRGLSISADSPLRWQSTPTAGFRRAWPAEQPPGIQSGRRPAQAMG
jgi:hypothetical protein